MTLVTKSDGRREPFGPGKLRKALAAAACDSGVPADRCMSTVNRVLARTSRTVARRELISSWEIRRLVLGHLRRAEPRIARSFDERARDGWFG